MPVTQMLETHPTRTYVDTQRLVASIDALLDCAQTCTSCADACLGEDAVEELRHCVRTCLDCADICGVTARVVSRQTQPDWLILRAQLESCATACSSCAAECEHHAEHHEHCRVCAASCRKCQDACRALVHAMPG